MTYVKLGCWVMFLDFCVYGGFVVSLLLRCDMDTRSQIGVYVHTLAALFFLVDRKVNLEGFPYLRA